MAPDRRGAGRVDFCRGPGVLVQAILQMVGGDRAAPIALLGVTFGSVVAQPYLRQLEELVACELPGISGLECKHFFSGAALYANSKICASLTAAGFAVKLPQQRCTALIETGKAFPLRYFEKSPIKRGYVLFPNASSLGKAVLASYLKECIAHARSRAA